MFIKVHYSMLSLLSYVYSLSQIGSEMLIFSIDSNGKSKNPAMPRHEKWPGGLVGLPKAGSIPDVQLMWVKKSQKTNHF